MNDSRHRLSAEISEEQARVLQQILPHGFQKILFQSLVDIVIDVHSKHGLAGLYILASGEMSTDSLMNYKKKGE
jgi:hypothetical protein